MSLAWYIEHGTSYLKHPELDEISSLRRRYAVPARYTPQIAQLIEHGVLGHQADLEGCSNVGEHCIYAGKLAEQLCWLVGMDKDESRDVTSYAYIHDAMLMENKKQAALTQSKTNGVYRINVGNPYYYAYEMEKEGIAQATSMDWRGYENWPLSYMVMRYVDSCIGPQMLPDGSCGNDCMQHWTYRLQCLQTRKSDISTKIGRELYGGIPAFDYLGTVMSDIEDILHEEATTAHPELFGNEYIPGELYFVLAQLMKDEIPQLSFDETLEL